MDWIFSMVTVVIVSAVLFVVGLLVRRFGKKSGEKVTEFIGTVVAIGAPIVCLIWVSTSWVKNSMHEIPAGQVGVVYRFGAIKGQVNEGMQTTMPWETVELANTQIQRHIFEKLESFTQETQTCFVKTSLNIKVVPAAIQELYRTVGPKFFDTLVVPRVLQNFKDEVVKYKAVDIAPNREVIRRAVSSRLEKELQPYSIEVVDLLLDNVDFRPEFESAIEAKQVATQKALEEEQRVKVAQHQAEQAIEKAKGDGQAQLLLAEKQAEATLALAEKQAEANKKLSESLTPALVQYSMIQKLSDKIQVMILPSGQNFILDTNVLKNGLEPSDQNKNSKDRK